MSHTARPGAADQATRTLTDTDPPAAEAGRPVSLTPEEFDAWMISNTTPLLLDPNG